jgi:hypothetical protein
MLVWINGPFGVGKTQTAYEIHRRLVGSVVCDPEHVGIGLHRMMPARLRSNFQDLSAWRQGVFEVLDLVLGKHDGDVIVPMTITQRAYFHQIPGALLGKGHQVRHYALLADRGTVLRRLRGRTLPLQHDRFAEANLDHCLDTLSHDDFAEHIWTDRLTVSQVADRIAASAGLTLAPDPSGALHARARQTWITIKHVRLG